ncbi:hypothetical protein Ancab_008801 [Ancistrocladus abbreviatus]
MSTLPDIEQNDPLLPAAPYTPLQDQPPEHPSHLPANRLQPVNGLAVIITSCLFLASFIVLIINGQPPQSPATTLNQMSPNSTKLPLNPWPTTKAKELGVSDKSFRLTSNDIESYPWTNSMFSWQRTAFHFQPEKNWMNGRW